MPNFNGKFRGRINRLIKIRRSKSLEKYKFFGLADLNAKIDGKLKVIFLINIMLSSGKIFFFKFKITKEL